MNIKEYIAEHTVGHSLTSGFLIVIGGIAMATYNPQNGVLFCFGLALIIVGAMIIGSLCYKDHYVPEEISQ